MAALTNELSWSRSRAGILSDCPRRYWFSYYGSWGGWSADAPERTREIYMLKQLSTRWMWVGSIVHEAIERVLGELRAGRPVDPAVLAEQLVDGMRAEFRASRAGAYRSSPKKVRGLFEHEYGVAVSPDQWREIADLARRCLATFFQLPYPAEFAALPESDWLPVEELASFELDGVRVIVKPDAALRRPDGIVEILDWKTGRATSRGPDPIQLACYALFAIERGWADSPEGVATAEVGLATGQVHRREVTAAMLDEVRGKIRASIAEMRALLDDPERNLATEERFPTRPSRGCGQCNFRRLCPDGGT